MSAVFSRRILDGAATPHHSPSLLLRWLSAGGFAFPAFRFANRLADNPDIDIVYVVTPNALHAENTIAAVATAPSGATLSTL